MTHSPLDILMLSEAYCTHTRRWAAGLAAAGLRVAVLSQNPAEPIEGIETLRFQVPPPSLKYPARWLGRYRKALGEILSRLAPRLVHMHFLDDWRLDRELLGPRPLVISTWGADVLTQGPPEDADLHRRKAALLQLADRVSATTRFLADATAAYGPLPREAIEVIPFGVVVEDFAAAAATADRPPTVGFLKHLEPKYGPDVLLKAFAMVLDALPAAKLVFYGDGSMRAGLARLADELGATRAVTFHGAIPYSQVPAAMAGMDVYAMPSVHASETFGVSAVEAQAAAVPVVASRLPGVTEAVQDGVTAILTPPGDATALAAALRRLLADGELLRKMGRAGRAFVAENFQWSRCVQRMMDLYRSVLEKHD